MPYCYRQLNPRITKLPYFAKSLSNNELRQKVDMNVSLEQKYKRPSDMLLKLYYSASQYTSGVSLQPNTRGVHLLKPLNVGCISASQYKSVHLC